MNIYRVCYEFEAPSPTGGHEFALLHPPEESEKSAVGQVSGVSEALVMSALFHRVKFRRKEKSAEFVFFMAISHFPFPCAISPGHSPGRGSYLPEGEASEPVG